MLIVEMGNVVHANEMPEQAPHPAGKAQMQSASSFLALLLSGMMAEQLVQQEAVYTEEAVQDETPEMTKESAYQIVDEDDAVSNEQSVQQEGCTGNQNPNSVTLVRQSAFPPLGTMFQVSDEGSNEESSIPQTSQPGTEQSDFSGSFLRTWISKEPAVPLGIKTLSIPVVPSEPTGVVSHEGVPFVIEQVTNAVDASMRNTGEKLPVDTSFVAARSAQTATLDGIIITPVMDQKGVVVDTVFSELVSAATVETSANPLTVTSQDISVVKQSLSAKEPDAPVVRTDSLFVAGNSEALHVQHEDMDQVLARSVQDTAVLSSEHLRTVPEYPKQVANGTDRIRDSADTHKSDLRFTPVAQDADAKQATEQVEATVVTRRVESFSHATIETIDRVVVSGIRSMSTEGRQSMTVKLIPENLGEVQIRITQDSDTLTVRIASVSSMVRGLLENSIPILREALLLDGHDNTHIAITADLGNDVTGFTLGRDNLPHGQDTTPSRHLAASHESVWENDATATIPRSRPTLHEGGLNVYV